MTIPPGILAKRRTGVLFHRCPAGSSSVVGGAEIGVYRPRFESGAGSPVAEDRIYIPYLIFRIGHASIGGAGPAAGTRVRERRQTGEG